MKPVMIKLHIDEGTRREIESMYGKCDYATIKAVVSDIFWRYTGVEYYDPEMSIEDEGYKRCKHCGEKSVKQTTIDADGKNLKDCEVCENCGSEQPPLR